ncbi:MAG: lytic transglycosylase domain-containing protein, partial [Pseudobdellovibrionaceae bacterium]
SSYIAQTYFSQQRAHFGLSGVRYLWDFAYPKAYAEKVEQAVKKFSVPEELVWGIMRAESQYRRDAISPVGALGLMQVMPYTGQRIAKLLNDTSFQTQQLLQPETAIKMGTFYLKRLMNKFDNSTPLVAAGYNAGPHRVKNWLISFGHLDMDEFIDHIPFLETRNYVKKVVANTHVYGQMYKDKKNQWTFLSNPISVKPDANLVTKESWDEI